MRQPDGLALNRRELNAYRRYFDLAAQPDSESYFALFAEGAKVEDEGAAYEGLRAIRPWRARVPLVHYTLTNIEQTPDALVATTTIAGDFPGSPVAERFF